MQILVREVQILVKGVQILNCNRLKDDDQLEALLLCKKTHENCELDHDSREYTHQIDQPTKIMRTFFLLIIFFYSNAIYLIIYKYNSSLKTNLILTSLFQNNHYLLHQMNDEGVVVFFKNELVNFSKTIGYTLNI